MTTPHRSPEPPPEAAPAPRREAEPSGAEPEDPDREPRPRHDGEEGHGAETDEERAERLASEVAEENPDPVTRREAIEQALADEDVSDEGEELGQHND